MRVISYLFYLKKVTEDPIKGISQHFVIQPFHEAVERRFAYANRLHDYLEVFSHRECNLLRLQLEHQNEEVIRIEFKPILDDLLYKLSNITQRHHQFGVVRHLSHN